MSKQQINLKDQKKNPVNIIDCSEIRICDQLTQDVDEINKIIQSAFIDLILTNDELTELQIQMRGREVQLNTKFIKPRRLDFSDKWFSRTFNNSSFEQGGRFYGGWYNSSNEYRPFITINNWIIGGTRLFRMHINSIQPIGDGAQQDYFEDLYLISDLDESLQERHKNNNVHQ